MVIKTRYKSEPAPTRSFWEQCASRLSFFLTSWFFSEGLKKKLRLVDPSQNRLASKSYFATIFSIILGSLLSGELFSMPQNRNNPKIVTWTFYVHATTHVACFSLDCTSKLMSWVHATCLSPYATALRDRLPKEGTQPECIIAWYTSQSAVRPAIGSRDRTICPRIIRTRRIRQNWPTEG